MIRKIEHHLKVLSNEMIVIELTSELWNCILIDPFTLEMERSEPNGNLVVVKEQLEIFAMDGKTATNLLSYVWPWTWNQIWNCLCNKIHGMYTSGIGNE